MTRIRILPYKQGSKSAKALAVELGVKVLKLVGSTFVPREEDLVINWGNSSCLWPLALNASVDEASNKLKFFYRMQDTGLTPEFWTNQEEIPDDAFPVVCRTQLTGHSGAGIVIADNRAALVSAPLYVRYKKKKEEYRIHVGRTGEETVTFSAQRKARRSSVADGDVNWQVRNLAGGFVYTREGFTVPNAVEDVAHRCLRQTGLDFGAVDVIWNEHEEKAYVLEVNTAPGLEGTTVTDYAEFFRELVG